MTLRSQLPRAALGIALSVLLAACSGPGGNPDGGGTDASTDAPVRTTPSGVTAAMCTAAIDINAMGTTAGDTVTIRGSTVQSTELFVAPCNPITTGHQVYRYRVRGNGVSLRVTTGLPGGTPYLDTIVWALQGACSESATVLECNDDDYTIEDPVSGASTFATPSLASGTEVYLVVAGYARARRGATARGEYTLSVTELPSAAAGEVCDSSRPGGCVSGLECSATSVTSGICVTPQMEAEPNNDPASSGAARAVGTGLAIHASIDPPTDVDCFALDVAAGSTLWMEASDGRGSCTADLRFELFRAGEAMSFEADDDTGRATDVACPRLLPMDNPGLRQMPAGTYTLCVSVSPPAGGVVTTTVPRYSVHVAPASGGVP